MLILIGWIEESYYVCDHQIPLLGVLEMHVVESRFPLLLQALLPKSLSKTVSKPKSCHPQSVLKAALLVRCTVSEVKVALLLRKGIGEVGVQHLAVFSADLASETESRSGCQSSRAVPNDSACEVHCVSGQSGTSSAKEGIGEVGVQHQEVSSPVFSADLASDDQGYSACVTSGSPHLPDSVTQDDQGNSACVTSGSPHLPDSVTQGGVRRDHGLVRRYKP
ncbi:unnamed protein product [Arctogadus glacialis]